MKNRHLRILLSLVPLTLLAACPLSSRVDGNQFTFALSEFPETGVTFQVELQSFDSSGNYLEGFDLGTANADSVIRKTITLTPEATGVGVYLRPAPSGEPSYFMWAQPAYAQDRTVTMRFWADYYA